MKQTSQTKQEIGQGINATEMVLEFLHRSSGQFNIKEIAIGAKVSFGQARSAIKRLIIFKEVGGVYTLTGRKYYATNHRI